MAKKNLSSIKVGQVVDAYFDGKQSPSRHVPVEITFVCDDIMMLKKKYRLMWCKALHKDTMEGCVHYCSGLPHYWDWNCTEFILGKIVNDKETTKDPILFAKRGWGGWYGVNWNYMLDVSGKVRKGNWATWQECAKEMGQAIKWNKKTHRIEYYDQNGKLVEIC